MKTCSFCGAANRDESLQCIHCNRELSTRTAPTQPVRVSPPALLGDSPTEPIQVYPALLDDPYPPAEPPPPTPDIFPGRFWPLLIFSLAGVFVCVGVLVALSLSSLNGSRKVAAQFPTPWPTLAARARPTPAPILPAPIPVVPSSTQMAEVKKLLSPECASALDRLGSFSSRVSSRPTVLLDAGWRSGFTQAVTAMRTSCGSLDSASPVPAQVSGVHRSLALASSKFDQAIQSFDEGLRTWNPSRLLQAGQNIQQATHALNQAIEELHQIGQ
jgi:hypothetical protein